jgi:hypothetical protein
MRKIESRTGRIGLRWLGCVAVLGALLIGGSAQAVVSVPPGGDTVLMDVDGGGVDCRRGTFDGVDSFPDCVLGGFTGTSADPGGNSVRARSRAALSGPEILTAIGIPGYATAHLYKDIVVDGPPGTHVPVEISALFDYKNLFLLAAAYTASSSLSLYVIDLHTGLPVASKTMFETNRDGDQGFTDIAASDQRLVLVDSSSDLKVLLRRGRDYRIVFELEVMSQVLAVGFVEGDATAELKKLTVRVDEDDVEQLADHDDAVRSELADHDYAVRTELATHDGDIKELLQEVLEDLAELRANQYEIVRLLNTPQGQRSSDLLACNGIPCDFPDKSEDTGPLPVAGIAAFCSPYTVKKVCKQSDWLGDEPSKENPKDCGWKNNTCVPY